MKGLSRVLTIKNSGSIYLYSVVVGILSGVISIIFALLLDRAELFTAGLFVHNEEQISNLGERFGFISDNPASAFVIVFLPAFGGLLTGIFINKFCREAKGTGTDEMINAFHNKEGKIDERVPVYKGLTTIFTLSSGGSGGKEGPISLIGAGIGVWVSKLIGAGSRARRTLLLSGTAAGLGATFKTPLGGALTAAEMVYKEDIETDALIPCFIASVTAYLVYTTYAGSEPIFNINHVSRFHLSEIGFYLLLGLLCFIFGYLLIKGFNDAKKFVSGISIPLWAKPAIGGLLTGLLAVIFFEVFGTGHNFLDFTYKGSFPNLFGKVGWIYIGLSFLVIASVKIIATTLTIGSGGSAGIFGPSLFIGAMLGGAVGAFAKIVLNDPTVSITSFMVVGMSAFYAGVANAPIAGIVMIVEMTGSYVLLPPVIIVSIFTFILSRQISFYKHQVLNRFHSPAHKWDMKFDIIGSISIREFFPEYRLLAMVGKDISLAELKKIGAEIHASDFVVVNNTLHYEGMISIRGIGIEAFQDERSGRSIRDYIDKSVPVVSPSNQLSDVLRIITEHDVDKVAVVENMRVLGYIRSKDVFDAYNESLKRNKEN